MCGIQRRLSSALFGKPDQRQALNIRRRRRKIPVPARPRRRQRKRRHSNRSRPNRPASAGRRVFWPRRTGAPGATGGGSGTRSIRRSRSPKGERSRSGKLEMLPRLLPQDRRVTQTLSVSAVLATAITRLVSDHTPFRGFLGQRRAMPASASTAGHRSSHPASERACLLGAALSPQNPSTPPPHLRAELGRLFLPPDRFLGCIHARWSGIYRGVARKKKARGFCP
jgi:hypothetical protein